MFLIPFAVIGFKMYEKHKEEEERKNGPQEPSSEEPMSPKTVLRSLESVFSDVSATTDVLSDSEESDQIVEACDDCNEEPEEGPESESTTTDVADAPVIRYVEGEPEEEDGPFAGIRRFFQKDEAFVIKANKEQLTYEVLGNQGANALPFPKISYR